MVRYQIQQVLEPFRTLPAHALREVLREGYGKKDLKADLLAGLVVGVVALPLAMALAIAVGAPPQHGLYTSVIAGFVTALLGGSRTQVSGPTAAFVVILAPIYAKFGLGGLLISGLMGGIMLLLMGVLRFGRWIQFVPHPVTTGFTAGIATVIAVLQLKDLFGLRLSKTPDHFLERIAAMFEARGTASLWDFSLGALTLALLLLVPKITRRIPPPLIALPAAAIVAAIAGALIPDVSIATIASRFSTEVGGVIVRGIPQLPPLPVLPWAMPGGDGAPVGITLNTLRELLPGAFAIAMLGAIESLLSAVVADGMARTKHDPDAELFAQGVANILCPFFGGIPATGAIARTATNVRSGGRTPVAAMVHAFTVLAVVVVLAPIIGYVPMASLAALLLLVAWNMSEARHFVHTVKIAPGSDVTVLLTCYTLTVVFDMVIAVSVGVVLAALLFMRRMAEVTEARLVNGASLPLPSTLPDGVVVYDITGPLFFGAAQKAMATLRVTHDSARVVILRLEQVPAMDATGLVALESAMNELWSHKVKVVLCGVQSQPRNLLANAKLGDRPGQLRYTDDVTAALTIAREHLGRIGPVPVAAAPVAP